MLTLIIYIIIMYTIYVFVDSFMKALEKRAHESEASSLEMLAGLAVLFVLFCVAYTLYSLFVWIF